MESAPDHDVKGLATNSGTFEQWLLDVGCAYKSLTDGEKIRTLDHLIKVSEAKQLRYLHEELSTFLKRDFLRLLPPEVKFYLLGFLDVKSLLSCCLVSKQWNDDISSCALIWKRACIQIGVSWHEIEHHLEAREYKNLYMQATSCLDKMQSEDCFEQKVLMGHFHRVMAVFYYDGKLATGSDDRTVKIWDCESGLCLKTLSTHTVADVKFDDNIVVTGSFDTTAATWNINSGQLIKKFEGNVTAVFSVDYDVDLDVLITGAAEGYVGIWNLTEGILNETLFCGSHLSWVTWVKLSRTGSSSTYNILSRDEDCIMVWKVKNRPTLKCSKLKLVTPESDLLPGMQLLGSFVSFASMEKLGHLCHLCRSDLQKPEEQVMTTYEVPRGAYVKAYLGGGTTFHVLLIDGETQQPCLDVVHYQTGKCVASINLPPNYRESKRRATTTLGEVSWLDGFHGRPLTGVFFASSQKDNSVLLLKWNNTRHENPSTGK